MIYQKAAEQLGLRMPAGGEGKPAARLQEAKVNSEVPWLVPNFASLTANARLLIDQAHMGAGAPASPYLSSSLSRAPPATLQVCFVQSSTMSSLLCKSLRASPGVWPQAPPASLSPSLFLPSAPTGPKNFLFAKVTGLLGTVSFHFVTSRCDNSPVLLHA